MYTVGFASNRIGPTTGIFARSGIRQFESVPTLGLFDAAPENLAGERRESQRDEPNGESGDDLVGLELDTDDGEQEREERAREHRREESEPERRLCRASRPGQRVRDRDAGERRDDEDALRVRC